MGKGIKEFWTLKKKCSNIENTRFETVTRCYGKVLFVVMKNRIKVEK